MLGHALPKRVQLRRPVYAQSWIVPGVLGKNRRGDDGSTDTCVESTETGSKRSGVDDRKENWTRPSEGGESASLDGGRG